VPDRPASDGRLTRTLPVLAAFVVGAIAYAPLYCFPLLAPEFESEFGASRELGQIPWTVFLLASALASPLLGRAYDLLADRLLLMAGMLLIAVGWAVASAAPTIWALTAIYGIALALGVQLVFVGTTTAIARRYAGMTGLALGVAYAGPGIGVALALPIAATAIPDLGWRAVAVAFAGISLAGVPFAWLMTAGPAVVVPARARAGHGARPAETGTGLHEASAPGAIAAAAEPAPAGARPSAGALRRTIRTRRFLILLIGAIGIGCIDEGVYQLSPRHAILRGLDPSFVAFALALQAYAYVAGQVLGGGLSDRFGRRFVGLLCGALIAIGTTGIFLATDASPALLVAGNVVYGFGIGATIAIRSAAFSDVFGGRDFGAVFGIVAMAYPAGGVIVMNSGSSLFDALGTYWPVYWIVMASLLAWSTALWVAGPRRHGLRARLAGVRSRLPI
jgi:MFS family permease